MILNKKVKGIAMKNWFLRTFIFMHWYYPVAIENYPVGEEKDMYEWMEENMGPKRGRLLTVHVDYHVIMGTCETKLFCFRSNEDLMAFKLRWC